MNRHDRRAAGARGEHPATYTAALKEMGAVTRRFLANGTREPPRFAFPRRNVLLACGVDQVTVAQNDSARELLAALVTAGMAAGGEPPTVAMTDAVLATAGVVVDRVDLAELGLDPSRYRIIRRGSGSAADN